METLKRPLIEVALAVGIGILALLPFFLYGIFVAHPKQTVKISAIVSPTPIPLVANQQYVSVDNSYTVKYPSSWTPVTYPDDPLTNFVFNQDGKEYKFVVSPPGQINPEGMNQDAVTTEVTNMNYGGKEFTITLWSNNSKPFFIEAIPSVDTIPYFFSLQLPPRDTDRYINVFKAMIASYAFRNIPTSIPQ